MRESLPNTTSGPAHASGSSRFTASTCCRIIRTVPGACRMIAGAGDLIHVPEQENIVIPEVTQALLDGIPGGMLPRPVILAAAQGPRPRG